MQQPNVVVTMPMPAVHGQVIVVEEGHHNPHHHEVVEVHYEKNHHRNGGIGLCACIFVTIILFNWVFYW